MVATLFLWAVNPKGQYYLPQVVPALNLMTRAVAWVLVAYLMGRSFLASGAAVPLLFGLGVTFWGGGCCPPSLCRTI